MTHELKGYSAKAKVKKALERQAAKLPEDVEVLSVDYQKGEDGKWYGQISMESAEPFDTSILMGFAYTLDIPPEPLDAGNKQVSAPASKPRGPRGHSTIDGPCFTVWAMADDMPEAKRGEVIAACQKVGVAFYTARTQYQKWSKARKGGDKSMPAKKEQLTTE